ncbi:MAG: aminoacyl-tRNA hydrolase [Deltaproteobacteria bacterium]|nr:MAG: aminoacyl-tRNA hydrolase [Deltaproteobacteria bacterium]
MRLVAGLGNPGSRYQHTRHNLGFEVIEVLSQRWRLALSKHSLGNRWGQGRIAQETVLLAQPYNYMNRSGPPVRQLLDYFRLGAEDLLVIHDDLDVPLGRLKIVRQGGGGGHLGVSSIIQALGTQEFSRLKAGIGRPQHGETIEDYVLSPCYPEEAEIFNAMIERAAQAVETILTAGVAEAMSRFHGPPPAD